MKAAELEDQNLASGGADDEAEPLARVDGPAKVTGSAQYASDIRLPGQLFAAVLRSPHPHARVTSVDTAAALAMPGVVAALTSDDLDDLTWYQEETPFFSTTVRFVGDEVAAVAATSIEAARAAVEAIEVGYERIDHNTDFEAAADGDQPAVHGDRANIADGPNVTERGTVDSVFDGDVAHIVEGTFRTPAAIHNAMEAHACTAQWLDDRLTLYASTQGVNAVREELADVFELDHNRVRIIAEHVGGGFGAKQVPWKNTVIAAKLAQITARPVQLVLDRPAENVAAGKRGATRQHVRLAADDEGRLLAIDATVVADTGAYSIGGEATDLSGPYLHLYRCDNVRVSMTTVYTNTGPAVAFRAPGYVDATFALESSMDELADRLGIDPIELRRRNYIEHDQQQDLPWSSPAALRVSFDRVAEVADWSDTRRGTREDDGCTVLTGRGFAAHEWRGGGAIPPGYAWIEINTDGSIHAMTSAQDIGTGVRTSLTDVIAKVFQTDPSRVRLTLGDTAAGPPAPTSGGSVTTPTMAPALAAAAHDALENLFAAAAELLGCQATELTLANDTLTNTSTGESHELASVLADLDPQVIRGSGGRVETPDDVSVRTFGSAIADVDVNTATGEIRVTHIVVAPDCGLILNPTLVDSQVIGGVTQGIGFALTEEQLVDHRLGLVTNDNFEEYLIPTMADLCTIEHAEVNLPDFNANALGVKGVGELPLVPVPAAIANAIAAATGHRFRELPITRRRVLDELRGSSSVPGSSASPGSTRSDRA